MKTKDIKSKKYTGVYHRILANGSKTYYILYKDSITGKKIRVKVGNSKDGFNETYCNNFRNENISKLRLGENTNIPIIEKKRHQVTLNDLSIFYFKNKRIEKAGRSTEDRAKKYEKHYIKGLGSYNLSLINRKDIDKFKLNLISCGYANQTVNSTLDMPSTIINYAIKKGHYNGDNPFKGIEKLPVNNERQRFLTQDEIKLLLKEVSSNQMLYIFTMLALTTGARMGAIRELQVKDINLESGTIDLTDLKSGGRYKGFIKDDVKPLLEKCIKGLQPNSYIISKNGTRIKDIKSVQRPMLRILDKLFNKGLDKEDREHRAVIHTLRHTFGSLLGSNGAPLLTIKTLMHHTDIKQTLRYVKLAPDSGREDINSIF